MIHNTHFYQFITPLKMHLVTGTWAPAAGGTAGWVCMSKTAAANTPVITIPIDIPQNSIALQGSKLVSIDLWYEIATAAANAITPVINKCTLPADNTAYAAVAAQVFSYDTGHDTAAKRYAVQKHKMTLTLTTPIWLSELDEILVQLTADCAATTALTIYGARALFTFRT